MKPAWRMCIIITLATLALSAWLIVTDQPLKHYPQSEQAEFLPDSVLDRGRAFQEAHKQIAQQLDADEVRRASPDKIRTLYENIAGPREALRELGSGGWIFISGTKPSEITYQTLLIAMLDATESPPPQSLVEDVIAGNQIALKRWRGEYRFWTSVNLSGHELSAWKIILKHYLDHFSSEQLLQIRLGLEAAMFDPYQVVYENQWYMHQSFDDPDAATWRRLGMDYVEILYHPNHTRNVYGEFLGSLKADVDHQDHEALIRRGVEFEDKLKGFHLYNYSGYYWLLSYTEYEMQYYRAAEQLRQSNATLLAAIDARLAEPKGKETNTTP